jgi:RimJ/RimL family protein N-acetyltransferase
MTVALRPTVTEDLPYLTGGETPYDDWGPRRPRTEAYPPGLEAAGGLTVVEDDTVAGDVTWIYQQWGPNAASRNPMIGIWLAPSARGRGIGAIAQAQLVSLFFRHTPVNRVEAHTDVDNLAEQRALEKAGFTREGVIRGAQWRDGAYRDGWLYSVLRSQWGR